MIHGQCHICDLPRDLVDGHVFPRFLYTKYISAIDDGGRFLDIVADRFTNKQFKKNWFCNECDNELLGGFERSGGELLAKVEADPKATHSYDDKFLAFIASVAWRVLKINLDDTSDVSVEERKVLRTWKRYLRGLERGVGIYSHHAFLVYDQTGNGLHKILGGQYFREIGVIHLRLGPLAIVSFTRRPNRPLFELRNLDKSRIQPAGGSIGPLNAWVVGATGNLPMDLARLLSAHESFTTSLVRSSKAIKRDAERRNKRSPKK